LNLASQKLSYRHIWLLEQWNSVIFIGSNHLCGMQVNQPSCDEIKRRFFLPELQPHFGHHEAGAMWRNWLAKRLPELANKGAAAAFMSFPEAAIAVLEEDLAQLKKGVPLQYVLNEAWFLGRSFVLNKSVLIPRQETEELVHWILACYGEAPLRLLDLGTGSGIIPISLKLARPAWTLTGLDISPVALATAAENAILLKADVHWVAADMLCESWPEWEVLVSNPPYIPQNEADSLAPWVREHEPHEALFAPENDALLFYRAIAERVKQAAPGKSLFLELNHEKAPEIQGLFAGYETELRCDMQGKTRMLRVRW
jgi:release factor glutamine methyltransferase